MKQAQEKLQLGSLVSLNVKGLPTEATVIAYSDDYAWLVINTNTTIMMPRNNVRLVQDG